MAFQGKILKIEDQPTAVRPEATQPTAQGNFQGSVLKINEAPKGGIYAPPKEKIFPPTSWINYMPGELLKTTGEMLGYQEGTFPEGMKLTEKAKYFFKEIPSALKQVGKEYIKAPFRVATTIVEPWINFAYGLEPIEEKPITLPKLGEVPTTFYQYQQGRKAGLSPLEAGLMSGAGTAMDLAISAGFAQFFISKVPVKVASGEFTPTVKPDGKIKMTFGEPVKGIHPIMEKAQYYKIGEKNLLEVIPTAEKTIKVTGYNISRSQFENMAKKVGDSFKNMGITYTTQPPEIKGLSIPPDIKALVEGKLKVAPSMPEGPIITPPPVIAPSLIPKPPIPTAKALEIKPKISQPTTIREIKLPREKPIIETKIEIIEEGKEAETQANILFQLETAQKGERIHWTEYDGTPHVIGVDSSFPQWIPSELRSRKLFDAVLGHIKNDTLPTKADEVRLYNIVAKQLGLTEAIKIFGGEEEIDVSKLFADEKTNEQISKISRGEEAGVFEEIERSVSEKKEITPEVAPKVAPEAPVLAQKATKLGVS